MQLVLDCVGFDNRTTPPESDHGMAKIEERLATIETVLGIWKWIVGGVAGATFLLGISALAWCYHLGNKVAAIEQQLADGGNARIVADLKNPKSQQELQANLSTVIAQVQTARVNGTKPNAKKVEALSGALTHVIQSDPQLPEAWQAAAQLVSFKSSPQGRPVDTPCFTGGPMQDMNEPPLGANNYSLSIIAANCVADISDAENFSRANGSYIADWEQKLAPRRVSIIVRFIGAHIIYRGGPLFPNVTGFVFQNCTFDIAVPVVPPPGGRTVTQQLLEAKNLNNVSISGL